VFVKKNSCYFCNYFLDIFEKERKKVMQKSVYVLVKNVVKKGNVTVSNGDIVFDWDKASYALHFQALKSYGSRISLTVSALEKKDDVCFRLMTNPRLSSSTQRHISKFGNRINDCYSYHKQGLLTGFHFLFEKQKNPCVYCEKMDILAFQEIIHILGNHAMITKMAWQKVKVFLPHETETFYRIRAVHCGLEKSVVKHSYAKAFSTAKMVWERNDDVEKMVIEKVISQVKTLQWCKKITSEKVVARQRLGVDARMVPVKKGGENHA